MNKSFQNLINHTLFFGTALAQDGQFFEVMTEFGPFWTKVRVDVETDGVFVFPDLNAVMIMEAEEGGTMLDVGACIGRYSTVMSLKADKVLAFEPDPTNFELLKKYTLRFPNIQPHFLAVSNTTGKKRLFQCHERRGHSSLKENATAKSTNFVDVATVTLDDFCKDIPKITAVKIDVEGYEVEVVEGAKKTLTSHNPVISLETHNHIDCPRLTSLFKDLGYRAFGEFKEVDILEEDKQYFLKRD